MSLRFVLGASGSGKSSSMYQWVVRQAVENPDRQYLVLVPDQYTMQIQKQMVTLHQGHAILNIDVLSFGRLYHRVMEELGGDRLTPLDDTGKNLILRKLAGSMKDELPVLGRFMDRQGYISEVKGIISEMQQYGISPQDMEKLIEVSAGRRGLQARLEDILKLYTVYMEYQKDSYRTGETMYPILTGRLRESRLLKNTVVVLDGFTGFTPVQYPLVQELMVLAKEMFVLMTIDEEPGQVSEEQQLFYTSAKSISTLEKLAEKARVEVAPYIWCRQQHRMTGALAHFERNLFRQVSVPYEEETDSIRILQAAAPRQESFQVALEIKRLLREEGCKHRDIAVICADMDSYREHLQEAFVQLEIAHFIDASSKLAHNPVMELLKGLLEILERDFSYAGVMRYVRSGYCTLTQEESDLLELYMIQTGIRGRKAFLRPFMRKGKEFSLEKVNELRRKLVEELAPCLFEGEQTIRFYIEQIYTLMTDLKVEQKLAKQAQDFKAAGDAAREKEYTQIYRKVMDLFDQMVVLMGEESVSLESFGEILRAGFEELQVGLIPAKADQVLIGDLERTRLNQVRLLFVVGVNDVNIPGNNAKGGMISDMDREYLCDLGVEMAPTKRQLQFRQHFYLYQQMTKPSERLYLSYALTDNAEKEIRPSYFIGIVRKLFPKLQITKEKMLPEHVSELLGEYAGLLRGYASGILSQEDMEKLYVQLYTLKKYAGAEKTAELAEQAFWAGGQEMLQTDIAQQLYGTVLYGSISRLEQFAACPYAHFLHYGLGIKQAEEYVLESADLGTIFHDVLAGFSHDLTEDGYTWADFPEIYGEQRISQRLALLKEQYGDELLLDKARNGYALARADRILKRSIKVLQKHMQAGAFVPYGQELDFDVSCEWNAEKQLMMRLQGRIDRLDVATVEDEVYVKVVDYKSGNKQLELDCMYEGLQMQLIVYMDSALKLLSERYPKKHIHPAAMFYYRVADPVVSVEGEQDFDDLADTLLREHRSRGMVNGDPTAVHLLDMQMETVSSIIPVAFKKDGSFAKGSSVCSEEDFKLMQEFIHKKIYDMGKHILSGHIEKKPYVRKNQEEGCMYCPYKGVCGFDEKQYGYEKRRIPVLSDEEVWKKMRKECEGH